jgi:hypothetical protein
MGINSLTDGMVSIIKENPVASAIGGAGLATGLVLGITAIARKSKRRKTKRSKARNSRKRNNRIKHTKRGWKLDRAKRSKQSWEVAYQKRKRKRKNSGGKRRGKVYYARKTGQPYIILSNGRAKFIKGKRRK